MERHPVAFSVNYGRAIPAFVLRGVSLEQGEYRVLRFRAYRCCAAWYVDDAIARYERFALDANPCGGQLVLGINCRLLSREIIARHAIRVFARYRLILAKAAPCIVSSLKFPRQYWFYCLRLPCGLLRRWLPGRLCRFRARNGWHWHYGWRG